VRRGHFFRTPPARGSFIVSVRVRGSLLSAAGSPIEARRLLPHSFPTAQRGTDCEAKLLVCHRYGGPCPLIAYQRLAPARPCAHRSPA
jgi:hypothetical protein